MTQQDRPDNVTADAQQDEAADQRFDEAGAPDAGTPEARLAEAEAEAAELKDQLLRAAAELENVRRRAARDVENAHRYGIERFARDLLDVADSVELGLDAARQAEGEQTVQEGLEATLRLLYAAFERFGITRIEAAGKPFDPQSHEAMAAQPAPEAEPNTVIAVVQPGWRIHDRLLRPARVIVARHPEPGQP